MPNFRNNALYSQLRKYLVEVLHDLAWQKKNFNGMSLLALGYFVSTVGTDDEVVRAYIRDQKKEDHRLEQLSLFKKETTEWWSVILFDIKL